TGKQHKAFCKAKTMSSVNHPLHILHMDLFGPTSAEAVNTACYVLYKVLVTKLQNKTFYEILTVENQANKSTGSKEANNSAGTQANDDQGANTEEIDLHDEYFILPIWSAYSTTEELEKLKRQEKEANDAVRKETNHANQNAYTNRTNLLNGVSTPISTAGPSIALNDDEPSYSDDPSMPHLEDIYASPSEGIFIDSSYDDEVLDERGVVIRNKERLVAQGHRQEEGIDYDEVFTPVARIEAIRIFLAFASYMGFIVYQMDVKSAFLYGTIDEEVYVTQPFGFVDPKFPNKFYTVVKALYGLHQAPRADVESKEFIKSGISQLSLNQKKQHVFNVLNAKLLEIAFFEFIELLIISTHKDPIQMLVVMPFDDLKFGDSDDSTFGVDVSTRLPVDRKSIKLLTFAPPIRDSQRA
nr:copia protein [Tanacetum cinerariifolium]GEY11719.1 copia protein [Tanacetum cinerariifolium]